MQERLLRSTAGAPIAPVLILFAVHLADGSDRSAFRVLTPEIRDDFGLDNEGILGIIALVSIAALAGQTLIGFYADRMSRVKLSLVGATTWGLFTLLTGIVPVIGLLIAVRCLTAIGRA